MSGGKPSEPDGEEVFAETESPVAERFGNSVDSSAGGSVRAVRGESDSASKECGGPAPLRRNGAGCSVSNDGRGRRANEGVRGVPNGVEIRNFVSEKFDEVESDRDPQN